MKFVEKNGTVWPSKKAYNHYIKNIRIIMEIYFAFEDYVDDTDDRSVNQDEGFQELFDMWKTERKYTAEELTEKTDRIVKNLNKLIDKVGRENFEFYGDDDISYICRFKLKYEEGKNETKKK